jgi:integrase
VPRSQTPAITEAINQYMKSKAHMRPKTVQNQGLAIRRFARHVGADRPIGNLTATQVERFFTTALAGQQASSVNKMKNHLTGFFDYCSRKGWVRRDLLVEIKRRPVPHVERLRITPLELTRMLDLPADPRDRAILAMLANSGLRAAELRSIQVRDVNLETEDVYVYRSKTYRDDYLPMTPTLRVEVRGWLMTYATELGNQSQTGDMYLFPARRAGVWLPGKDEQGVQRREAYGALKPFAQISQPHLVVKRTMSAMGYADTKFQGVHTVRRSVARAYFDSLVEQGYDHALRATMALLGHEQQATTELYIGLDQDRRRRDVTLRARDFLPFGHAGDNVVPLRRADG